MVSKEVIILGTGSSRVQCPYDCEVWGVNGIYSEIDSRHKLGLSVRLDKLFITDYLWSQQGHLHFDIQRVNRICGEFNTRVISFRNLSLGKYKIPCSIYPYRRIAKKFKTKFFSNTICYMLAYALDKNYTNFKLYGIDMHSKEEYMLQKGGIEYWLGRVMERGGEVFIAPGGAVMKTPNNLPYGFREKINFRVIDPYNLLKREK